MRFRFVPAVIACLAVAADARGTTTDLPKREFWVGSGAAATSEKNLFNLANDYASRPDPIVSLGYVRNFDSRRALCIHAYGGIETETQITLPGGQTVPYTMNTMNLGVRYRHTFQRGAFTPFAFIGCSWASGTLERKGTPDLVYNGASVCVGLGDKIRLGRHVMVSAEGMVSPGAAVWESAPFAGSSGKKFNPSLASAMIHLGYVWGSIGAASPPKVAETVAAAKAPGSGKGVVGLVAEAVLAEGLIVFNSGMAAGSPLGFGIVFLALSPLAAGEVHGNSRAETITTIAIFESIGVYDLIMAGGDHSEETIFTGNMIAWNTAIGLTWVARKTVFKPQHGGGGSGTKGWSGEPDVVSGAPGVRVGYRF